MASVSRSMERCLAGTAGREILTRAILTRAILTREILTREILTRAMRPRAIPPWGTHQNAYR